MSVEGNNRGIEEYQVPPGQQGEHGEKAILPPKGFDRLTTAKLEALNEMYRNRHLDREFRLKLPLVMDAIREGKPVDLQEMFAKKQKPKREEPRDPMAMLKEILSMSSGEEAAAVPTMEKEVGPAETKAAGVVPEEQVIEERPLSPREREQMQIGEIVSAINGIRTSLREEDRVKAEQLVKKFNSKFAKQRIGMSNFDLIRHTDVKPIFKELSDGNFWAIQLEGDTFAVIKYPTSAYTHFDHYGGNELFDVQAVEGEKPLTGKDLVHRDFSSDKWELVKPAIVRRSGQELEVLQKGELALGKIEPR